MSMRGDGLANGNMTFYNQVKQIKKYIYLQILLILLQSTYYVHSDVDKYV